jgi:hypothetical protein
VFAKLLFFNRVRACIGIGIDVVIGIVIVMGVDFHNTRMKTWMVDVVVVVVVVDISFSCSVNDSLQGVTDGKHPHQLMQRRHV